MMNFFRKKKTVRGAVAGGFAAAIWIAQQPLDKRVFQFDYDDAELLGKIVTRRRGSYVIGALWHVLNGAFFGAIYANVNAYLPLPRFLRAPTFALFENFATWPMSKVADKFHPARD